MQSHPLNTMQIPLALEARNSYIEFVVHGERLTCDWTGCLYWRGEETLIVSDLHLEKGSSFARAGSFIPPYDTRSTLKRLAQCVAFWNPKRIISLGDSFHDPLACERLDKCDEESLKAMMDGREWIWITGNHDPAPPTELGGMGASKVLLGALTFRHEPKGGEQAGEIAGHLHPVGKISRRSKTVRRPCFVTDGVRMILPSFGAYTGGLNIRHEAFRGIFDQTNLSAVMLGRGRVFHIPARALVK